MSSASGSAYSIDPQRRPNSLLTPIELSTKARPPFGARNCLFVHWDRPMNAIERFSRSARRPAGVITGLLLFGAVCLAQAPTAPPAKLMVADVLPDGNRSVPTQKIMSIIKTRPGSEFSQETVNDDVRELYKTRLFANVRADI